MMINISGRSLGLRTWINKCPGLVRSAVEESRIRCSVRLVGQPEKLATKGLAGRATERSLSDRKTGLWDNPVWHLCAGIPRQHGRRIEQSADCRSVGDGQTSEVTSQM